MRPGNWCIVRRARSRRGSSSGFSKIRLLSIRASGLRFRGVLRFQIRVPRSGIGCAHAFMPNMSGVAAWRRIPPGSWTRLEQEICPTLPDIVRNNRIATQDVARLVLVSGVLDRSPANLPAWLINGSPTLMAARQKKLANGEVFDAAEWFVPEERWMDIRDQILVEYRQKYTR